jgi:hypothetical protein
MTKRKKSTRNRKPEFRVVTRGYRRSNRDIAMLQRASLDYFIAEQERLAQVELAEPLDTPVRDEDQGGDRHD